MVARIDPADTWSLLNTRIISDAFVWPQLVHGLLHGEPVRVAGTVARLESF